MKITYRPLTNTGLIIRFSEKRLIKKYLDSCHYAYTCFLQIYCVEEYANSNGSL